MGPALVGSACPAAWLIVTVGATLSNKTELSMLVEAKLEFPRALLAAKARIGNSVWSTCNLNTPPKGRASKPDALKRTVCGRQ